MEAKNLANSLEDYLGRVDLRDWEYVAECLDRFDDYLCWRRKEGIPQTREVLLSETTRFYSDGPQGFEFYPLLSMLGSYYNQHPEIPRDKPSPFFISSGNLLEDLDRIS